MKYCSKCGEQNPDEAKFCKKCGEQLSQLSFTQKEKYNSLQKERESLSERCQELIAFYNDRKQLYECLLKDDQYETAIKDSQKIIERNKVVCYNLEREGKRNFIIAAIICSIIVIAVLVFCVHCILEAIHYSDNPISQIEIYVLFFFLSSLPFISLGIIESVYDKRIERSWMSYENDFTQTYLTPFIQKHEDGYEMIGRSNDALLYEIFEPEEITSIILQEIEKIENDIKILDKELGRMTK